MYRLAKCLLGLLTTLAASVPAAHAQVPLEQAWQELPRYEYGQDLAGQLVIERSVIEAMNVPAQRAKIAARLAELLGKPDTTLAAKQFVCLQLRQVGTPAEIPPLTELLPSPDTCQLALYALAAIPGPESTGALRGALQHVPGDVLPAVIDALGARRDSGCVERLEELAAGPEPVAAVAALRALSQIADERAIAWLLDRAAHEPGVLADELARCLLRAAGALAERGDRDRALLLLTQLADRNQRPATRRAALEGLLRLDPAKSAAAMQDWFARGDAIERQVAAAHLSSLPDTTLDELGLQVAELPETSSVVLIEVLAARKNQNVLPFLLEMVRSDVPTAQLAGLRCLSALRDPAALETLLDQLSAEEQLATVAQQGLARLPRDTVGPALLAALERKDTRGPVIAVLREIKFYEAINPLIAIASETDPAVYGPALDGLRGIADPDTDDIPRLMELLYRTQPGTHRDEVEKTIAVVCDKLPAGEDRAKMVLPLLADADEARKVLCLPLLGRLGGAQARQTIEPYLDAQEKNVRESAVRGLCNWPTADVADQLLTLATSAEDQRYSRWALRAYVRVVSLPSDRPPHDTLSMLQTIMQQAQVNADRALIISRAATVRTMECVHWVAAYLEDAALAQSACATLVELAHHRELRHPNMDQFGPILDKVAATSQDPAVVERAKRYRLGL